MDSREHPFATTVGYPTNRNSRSKGKLYQPFTKRARLIILVLFLDVPTPHGSLSFLQDTVYYSKFTSFPVVSRPILTWTLATVTWRGWTPNYCPAASRRLLPPTTRTTVVPAPLTATTHRRTAFLRAPRHRRTVYRRTPRHRRMDWRRRRVWRRTRRRRGRGRRGRWRCPVWGRVRPRRPAHWSGPHRRAAKSREWSARYGILPTSDQLLRNRNYYLRFRFRFWLLVPVPVPYLGHKKHSGAIILPKFFPGPPLFFLRLLVGKIPW